MADTNINKQLQVGIGFEVNDVENGLSSLEQHSDKLNKLLGKVATQLENIEKAGKKVSTSTSDIGSSSDKASNKIQSVSKEVTQIMNAMKSGTASAQTTLEQLSSLYQKHYNSLNTLSDDERKQRIADLSKIKDAEEKTQTYIQNLKKAGLSAEKAINNQSVNEFKVIEAEKQKVVKQSMDQQYRAVQEATKLINKEYTTSLNQVNSILGQTGSSSLTNSIFNSQIAFNGIRQVLNEFSNLGHEVVEINYNLINNQRLMGDFSSELRDQLLNSSADIAKNSNILIQDAQEIQGAWIRINEQYAKSPELLNKMSDITAKFMNVGEVEDAESAVKLLNSSLLQFNLTGENVARNAEEIANKFSYMADVTAMGTADEYAQGIAKMGANIENMNGDIDDAIVLLSIVGDKLAKNGEEAGNSLNTFTAYMHRNKSLNFFDDLAKEFNDMSLSLRDGEHGIKNYHDSLLTIADAYKRLREEGNDVRANELIESLGATRQRATAQAVLDAISSDDGKGSLEDYYKLLENATAQGSYLEQQNNALMQSYEAQWNSFKVTIQEFGMVLGNSGLLSSATVLINGLSGLFDAFNQLPEPIQKTATTLGVAVIAFGSLNKIGEVTGVIDKFNTLLNVGTSSQRQHALEVRNTIDAYISEQSAMLASANSAQKKTNEYIQATSSLNSLKTAVIDNDNALKNGSINAQQYTNNIQKLTTSVKADVTATTLNSNAKRVNDSVEKTSLITKTKVLASTVSENGYLKLNTLLHKNKYTSLIAEKIATVGSNAAQAIRNGLLATDSSNTVINTAAKGANTIATTLLTTATTALGVALNLVLSPLGLITIGITALNFLFGNSSSVDKYSKHIDELNNSISEATDRVNKLKEKQQQSGLSGTEQEELTYLEKRVKLENELINIENKKQNDKSYFGGKQGAILGIFGGTDDKSTQLQKLIDKYETLTKKAQEYSEKANNATDYEQQKIDLNKLSQINEQIQEVASKIIQGKYDLEDAANVGFSDENVESVNALIEAIGKMGIDVENAAVGVANLGNAISQIDYSTLQENLNDSFSLMQDKIGDIDSAIEQLKSGTADSSYLQGLATQFDGFSSHLTESTARQIEYLETLRRSQKNTFYEELNSQISQLETLRESLVNQLYEYSNQGLQVDDSQVVEATKSLKECAEELNKLYSIKSINLMFELPDLSDFTSSMDNLVSSTKELVEAQNKLATGAALSKQELYSLAMQYPELIYQADIFNSTTVDGQEAAINAVLSMKEQEFNLGIDTKIAELEAEKQLIEGVLDLEQQKFDILANATVEEANGEISIKGDVQEMLGAYNDAIGKQYTLAEQYKVDKASESAEGQVDAQNQAGDKIADAAGNAGEAVANNITEGAAAGADGTNRNANKVSGIFGNIINWAASVARAVAKAFSGDTSDSEGVGNAGQSGDRTNSFVRADYNDVDKTINGQTVTEWIKTQQEALRNNINQYKVQLGQINTAISNLEQFKNLNLGNVSNNYAPNGAQGGTGKADEAAQKAAEKAAKEAEKAAKEAAKVSEEARKAIEQITQQYVKNVESLQDRIVQALKKKYQEEYDERKKLLEKEHQARLDQIQKEIDKINGNTPEDKKNKLSTLQEQLAKWKRDESSLGKSKQKEYIEKIEDLEKEIKLDELESQIEDEKAKFDRLIDTTNTNCDKTLAYLENKLTDKQLYDEANNMIRNGQIQEICNLLTQYDAKWDGWATLMGQSAGDIIASQVTTALNNYLDVIRGTITPDGGHYTNNGGSNSTTSSSGSGSSSSSSSASKYKDIYTVKQNDTLWDLAYKYYGDSTKWKKIQDANGGINQYLLRIGQQLIIPFKTGGVYW